jgi:hypothetical protein
LRRLAKAFAIIVAIVLALAALSYMTTGVVWDGGFPSGEIRISVRDSIGQPVPNAALHVYRGGTRQLAFGYPISNHTESSDVVSDESGRIIAMQERDGLQFGGHRWELFWIIPMGKRSGPKFDCELSAPGYQTATFEIWRLFQSPYTMYEEFPKTKRVINGKEQELKVYDQTFTLNR